MNEFKGTKGKWYVKISNGCIEVFSKVKKGNKKVCSLFSKWYGAEEIQKANALLISKAPEMLEKLNDIKDYLGSDKRLEVEALIKSATEL